MNTLSSLHNLMSGPVGEVKEMKVVGFLLDNKWTFEPMLKHVSKKGTVNPNSVLCSVLGIVHFFTHIRGFRFWCVRVNSSTSGPTVFAGFVRNPAKNVQKMWLRALSEPNLENSGAASTVVVPI